MDLNQLIIITYDCLMLKQIIILSFLLCWGITQTIVGGYTPVDLNNIADEQQQKEIEKVKEFAKLQYSLKNNGKELKKLVSIASKVVSGVLYLLQFESAAGQNVVLQVYDEQWTNTLKLVQNDSAHP